MGNLVRKNGTIVLLAAVVAMLLLASLSPPATAAMSTEEHKLHLLELLGLNGSDEAVVKTAQEALTLYGVDVVPNGENINVIIKLSDTPEYNTYLYDNDRRRLVVDLDNTINLSPTSEFSLDSGDPIKRVRNSQYRVSPSVIARVVLDLDEGVTPEVTVAGNDLVISAPLPATASSEEGVEATGMAAPAEQPDTVDLVVAQANDSPAPEEASEEVVIDDEETSSNETPPVEELETVEEVVEPVAEEPAEEVVAEATVEEPETVEEVVEPAAEEPAEMIVAEATVEEPEEAVEEVIEEVETAPVAPAKPVVAAPPVAPAPAKTMAAAPVPVPAPAPDEDLITLTFRDADLNSVLDIISRKGKLNIIAGNNIKGSVTVRLVDVPLDVALDAILNVNGYGYVRKENIIRIVPLSQLGQEVETETQTFTLSYADAAKAKATLEGFLTTHGSIDVDARTNMIIVTDIPTNVDKIAALMPQIDRRVKQVLIEMLILDSVLTDDADMGIQWTVFDTKDSSKDLFGQNDSISMPFPLADNTALNLSFGTLFGAIKLEALVQAVVSDGDSRVLANPKLLTLNNETATISIVTEYPYQERTQTGEGGQQLVSTSFKEVGTKMDVKPQITHDGNVILFISPEQSNVVDFDQNGIPVIAKRESETTLIVKDHQTVVVGGLRENTDVVSMKKVPVLGDLPIAKYVFRSVQSRKQDTELLVFITVHIVENPKLLPGDKIKFDELGSLPHAPNSAIELIR